MPISVKGLQTIASLGVPIYWVGEKPGSTYELTKTTGNKVYVRYLPKGVPVGSDDPYLTVGTYPLENAFAITSGLAAMSGSVRIPTAAGSVAFYNSRRPTNVYVAYRGSNSQIEVYDPVAAEARQLVASGQLAPVPSASLTETGVSTTTPAGLKSIAAVLGHPIYWAGAEPGVTYELTRTSGGRIYLRYLPAGVKVGTKQPYLTVGTDPLQGAYAVTKAKSGEPGSVRVATGSRAVAFYGKSSPTNVYFAYPGVDVQVEVFDPAPARARGLIRSRRIVPVG